MSPKVFRLLYLACGNMGNQCETMANAREMHAVCSGTNMIRVDVSVETWTAKTGVEPSEWCCSNCGETVPIDVPVASYDYHGFSSGDHGCGENFTALVVTARSPRKIAFWKEILG